MSRLRPLVFFGALSLLVGCTQADGEPCDIDRDCGSSSICCGDGRLPMSRGICQPEAETCNVRPTDPGRDAAVVEDGGADGGIADDAGADAGEDQDAGSDAGTAEDAGTDAGSADAGSADAGSADAGSADAGVDAGTDAGLDAGA